MCESLREQYQNARMEHQWYREELLEMVDEGDQGTDLWDEYREDMKRTGREVMSLAGELTAEGCRSDA